MKWMIIEMRSSITMENEKKKIKKDYQKWHCQKTAIDHSSASRVFYHEREMWWCTLGVNIGFEQDGSGEEYRRPVLILRGLSKETCFVVPLTTATSDHMLRPSVGPVDGKQARVLLSQIRVIDVRRLVRKIGYLEQGIFEQIRKKAKDIL